MNSEQLMREALRNLSKAIAEAKSDVRLATRHVVLLATEDAIKLEAALSTPARHQAGDAVEVLRALVGDPDDPKIGWSGKNGDSEFFACEFCGQRHRDCFKIEHSSACIVPRAIAAVRALAHPTEAAPAAVYGGDPAEPRDDSDRAWPDPIGYLPAYELGRLHSGHDARLRSAKFGPSQLDGDVPVYLEAPAAVLPHDVVVGGNTFRKGVSLSSFIAAAQHWHREAFPEGYELTAEQKAANLALLQGAATKAFDTHGLQATGVVSQISPEVSDKGDAGQGEALTEMERRKDAAYLERNQVVAALAKCFPSGVARTAIEGWSEDWHGCVYIDLPTGQASWHFHDSQAYLFADLPPYRGTWDGHDTPEKYRRLASLAASAPAPQAAPVVPEGWKLLKDSTHAERSKPGEYSCTCVHCLRAFISHKRDGLCAVCAAAPDAKGGV